MNRAETDHALGLVFHVLIEGDQTACGVRSGDVPWRTFEEVTNMEQGVVCVECARNAPVLDTFVRELRERITAAFAKAPVVTPSDYKRAVMERLAEYGQEGVVSGIHVGEASIDPETKRLSVTLMSTDPVVVRQVK